MRQGLVIDVCICHVGTAASGLYLLSSSTVFVFSNIWRENMGINLWELIRHHGNMYLPRVKAKEGFE